MNFNNLSDLRNKVAELLIIRASGYSLDALRKYPEWELPNQELKRLLSQGIGGVILYGGTVQDIQNRTKQLQSWSEKKILLCADVEEGVGQRFEGGTWFVPPMALGLIYKKKPEEAILLAERYGRSLGEQAARCGLNWVLAPVCDINTNPENPVINMRSWGEDPHSVSKLVNAFNKGLISEGVLSCAKHFPGHGDTSIDSHLSLPVLEHKLDRLEEKELVPFKTLIEQNVNSIMTSHLLLDNIDPNFPVTLSYKLTTNILRNKINFKGLIVTDALVMHAISKRYSSGDAALMAFEAGADLIMMPENADEAIEAIVNGLINGRISMDRLEDSLARRKNEIAKLEKFRPFFKNDYEDLNYLEDQDTYDLSDKLINLSIETKNNYFLEDVKDGINLIRVDRIISNGFLNNLSPAITIPEKYGFKNMIMHSLGFPIIQDNSEDPLDMKVFGGRKIVLQLFIRGNPFIGQIYSQDIWISIIKQLQQNNSLSALLVYGSCYTWKKLISILDPSIPAVYSPGQMPLAQKKALDIIFPSSLLANSNKDISNYEVEFTN